MMTATYARTIRIALDAQRSQRVPFEVAWKNAAEQHPAPEDWQPVLGFMEAHYRAAYNRDMSKWGRCRVEHDGTPNRAAIVPTRISGRDDVPRCKSGDGCDREATRGRFGLWWCDHHGEELERIGSKLAGPVAVGSAPADAGSACP